MFCPMSVHADWRGARRTGCGLAGGRVQSPETHPNFVSLFREIRPNFAKLVRAVTTCGRRHHKFELLFPQLFERGAEDYVDRGRRGVAGRARSGVQAPGHSLQPIVSVIPALNDATSGGTASGSMDPPRETKHASFSKVCPFRSCAPGRPNFEEFRPKVGPTQISIKIRET